MLDSCAGGRRTGGPGLDGGGGGGWGQGGGGGGGGADPTADCHLVHVLVDLRVVEVLLPLGAFLLRALPTKVRK